MVYILCVIVFLMLNAWIPHVFIDLQLNADISGGKGTCLYFRISLFKMKMLNY